MLLPYIDSAGLLNVQLQIKQQLNTEEKTFQKPTKQNQNNKKLNKLQSNTTANCTLSAVYMPKLFLWFQRGFSGPTVK